MEIYLWYFCIHLRSSSSANPPRPVLSSCPAPINEAGTADDHFNYTEYSYEGVLPFSQGITDQGNYKLELASFKTHYNMSQIKAK